MKRIITLLIFCSQFTLNAQTPNLHWKYQDDGKSYAEDRGVCTAFDNSGNLIVAGYVESGCTSIDIDIIKYSATGDTLWEVTYDGSGSTIEEDYPTAITTDANGNIYVTGKTQNNNFFYAVTLKYDASGNLLWSQRYLTSESAGNDIAIDATGNVFICGFRTISNNQDFLLIKYNASGAEQWVENYSIGNYDEALALGVDPLGDIYVTGRQSGVNSVFDWVTLKYSTTGAQLWFQVYSNPDLTFSEEPVDLEIDNMGYVYVGGFAPFTSNSNRDYYVIKYDDLGNVLWQNSFNNTSANNDDYPVDMIVDVSGNVFLTGNSVGLTSGQDICTIKFNAAGNFVWQARIDSIQQTDYARSLGLDPTGNFVYVAGDITTTTANPLGRDIIITKLDTSGSEIARVVQNGPGDNFDLPYQLDVDANGNVAVTGMQSMNSAANGNGDVATQLFDAQLTPIWTRYHNGNSFTNDQGADMVVDETGNSYVCGFTRSGDIMYEDLVVFKVNKSGERVWEFIYGGIEETSKEIAVAIAIDAQKNVYVTGSTDSSTGQNYRDIYTVKLDPNGQVIWEQIYYGTGNAVDVPVAIAVDPTGNVYVAANTVNIGTGIDATLISYSSTGTLNWVTPVDKGGIAELFTSMTLDNQQNICAAGTMIPAGGALSDGLVVKFDPSGTVLWDTIYDFSPPTSVRDFFNCIAVDASNNVFVAGQSNSNFVTVKYSPAGIPEWIQNYSYSSFNDSASVIAVDVNNDVIVGGTFGQTVGADFGVVKYHNDGTNLWERRFTNIVGSDDIMNDIALDDDANIYVTGWETHNFTTNYNFMTLKYDSTGLFIYELIYEDSLGVAPDYGLRIGLDSTGNIYMMGDANENCYGNIFVNGYRWNTAVVRYGQGIFSGIDDPQSNNEHVFVYPNPANGEFNLVLPEVVFGTSIVTVAFYDVQGKLIYNTLVPGGTSHIVNPENWPSGMIFFVATNEQGSKSGKIILQNN